MSIVGRPPHRRGSKKSTDVRVGILNGKPSLQVNWGGRIYGSQLSLIGSGSTQDSLVVSDITASGNITFSKNSSVYNNSNRVLMVGGLVESGDTNMAIGDFDTLGSVLSGGAQNIGIGTAAGSKITTGDANICIGDKAGGAITTLGSSICIGFKAGGTDNDSSMIGGVGCVIIGHEAGKISANASLVTDSIFIGRSTGAGFGEGSESGNIGMGAYTLNQIQGNYNIGLGYSTGSSTHVDGDHNILIGKDCEVSANAATGQVLLGNAITGVADNTTVIGNTDIILDASGDITLDCDGGEVFFKDDSQAADTFAKLSSAGSASSLYLYEAGGATNDDYFLFYTTGAGATQFVTVDASGNSGHMTFNPDGQLSLKSAANSAILVNPTTKTASGTNDSTLKLEETLNLSSGAGGSDVHYGLWYAKTQTDLTGWDNVYLMYLDGGTTTKRFIVKGNGDVQMGLGADLIWTANAHLSISGHNLTLSGADLTLDASGDITLEADGHVEFDNCAVGFDRLEATFSTTAVIESIGSDDTDIDFRLSNKYSLELSNDINTMNLIFPNTSGNFLLVCHILGSGGGDHDVTAWKVWEHDSVAGATNAAATTDVMWAGGSAPAFTSGTATDIVSFYWDADEQQAYGVASLAFATP